MGGLRFNKFFLKDVNESVGASIPIALDETKALFVFEVVCKTVKLQGLLIYQK